MTTELAIHRSVLAYLTVALPKDATRPWHCASGEKRDDETAAKLKTMGVIPGLADLMFVYRGRLHAIEVKAPKGRPSAYQRVWQEELETAGGAYAVVTSIEEARDALARWGVPTREARRAETNTEERA